VEDARKAPGQLAWNEERPRSPCKALIEDHLNNDDKQSRFLMREQVAELKLERATPHDLRRTCLTWITRLGFGRDAMDRIANHRTSTVTDVYDRHSYTKDDKRIMSAVARHVLALVEGRSEDNVVPLGRRS
jgi:integrase